MAASPATATPVVVLSDSKDDADYVRGQEIERAAYVKGGRATADNGWSAALPHYAIAAARGYAPAIVKQALAARYGFKARQVDNNEARTLALQCIGTLVDASVDIKSIKVPPPPGALSLVGEMYLYGTCGLPVNQQRARDLWSLGAQHNCPYASLEYAVMIKDGVRDLDADDEDDEHDHDGEGDDDDDDEKPAVYIIEPDAKTGAAMVTAARARLLTMANEGDLWAAYLVAGSFNDEEDTGLVGLHLLETCAGAGMTAAQTDLAEYMLGSMAWHDLTKKQKKVAGVRDEAAAEEKVVRALMISAADAGDIHGMEAIIHRMLDFDGPIDRDVHGAYAWAVKAAALGSQGAIEALDDLKQEVEVETVIKRQGGLTIASPAKTGGAAAATPAVVPAEERKAPSKAPPS